MNIHSGLRILLFSFSYEASVSALPEDFVFLVLVSVRSFSVGVAWATLLYRHQRKRERDRGAVEVTEAAGAARKMFSLPPKKSDFFRSSQVPDVILVRVMFYCRKVDGNSYGNGITGPTCTSLLFESYSARMKPAQVPLLRSSSSSSSPHPSLEGFRSI